MTAEDSRPVPSDTDGAHDDNKGFDFGAVRARLGRLFQSARAGTERAGESVRRLAHDAKSGLDRRSVERKRAQVHLLILERFIRLNRSRLAEDRDIRDLLQELDVLDDALATLAESDEDAHATRDDDDPILRDDGTDNSDTSPDGSADAAPPGA